MHELRKALAEQIAAGLRRRAVTTCSRWAEKYRVMGGDSYPGPWRFDHHPWLKEMHDSENEVNIGQKSAQMGFTETVLNRVLFSLDVKGMDALYVLPAKTPDASDFSSARFDAALELSEHLSRMFSDTKNVGHKRAGAANLYIRGGRSRGGLKSIPVGLLVLDEVDEMPKENIPLAFQRMSGQLRKEAWLISTPTAPGVGINSRFVDSTQNHFFFRCPSCSRYIEFNFPQDLVITAESHLDPAVENSYLQCNLCKSRLEHKAKKEFYQKNQWVPSYTDRSAAGWYINQFYSTTITPADLARASLKSRYDEGEEQEYYNSMGGLPHLVKGAGVTDTDINDCMKGYAPYESYDRNRIVTMGVDVGKWLHYEIDDWQVGDGVGADLHINSRCRVLRYGKIQDFDELLLLMRNFNVAFSIIDAQPERRKSLEFAMKCYGHARVCFYEQGITGKNLHVTSEEEAAVKVDRTSWLDLALGRFRHRTIALPCTVDEEYRQHIKAQVRITRKDRAGNPVAAYMTQDNKEDHYGHARTYAEIALSFAASLSVSHNITSKVL